MKFWTFSSLVLATLLAVVSVANASGPSDGDAIADPNSAVVKLTSDTYKTFLEENPLVLAEFFAPWCGYCKQLGPEYAKAADSLNETHPKIKLAQVDCTTEEELCMNLGIKGYPTLKIIRDGADTVAADYDGPRDSNGIADYMIKQSLPAVQTPQNVAELNEVIEAQSKPFVVQINPTAEGDKTFNSVAQQKRKDYVFISVQDPALVKDLSSKFTNVKLGKKPAYLVVHPKEYTDVRQFSEKELTSEALSTFISTEVMPYFGDINRDTYMGYISSPLPIAYYFYNEPAQREAVNDLFNKLGKQYRGKINFVGLDATLFGKHAEMINMDPEIVPLFAIQHIEANKKYGISQAENPQGPSQKDIEKFVTDFFAGTLKPIVKSEDLPTEEEKAENPVVKLVGHNHREVVEDVSKDVFVEYYAPWCGHCKKLAPTWEELATIYGSNKSDAEVIIANIDHTNNDIDLPFEIEGYPTLVLYPANGEIDEKTGIRKPVVFSGARELNDLISFVKESGSLHVDGQALKEAQEGIVEDDAEPEAEAEVVEDEAEADPEAEAEIVVDAEDLEHDEL